MYNCFYNVYLTIHNNGYAFRTSNTKNKWKVFINCNENIKESINLSLVFKINNISYVNTKRGNTEIYGVLEKSYWASISI